MVRTVLVALLLAPTLAAAAPSEGGAIGGTQLTLEPGKDMEPVGGQMGGWLAYTPGSPLYVGGEIAVGSAARGHEDFAFTYHAVVGARAKTSPHTRVMIDGGLGVSQQIDFTLGIFGDETSSETANWAPSAAARVGLVGELGRIGTADVGIALTGDVRSTLDSDASPALGVGLGFVLAN